MTRGRLAALGGVIGPMGFVVAWTLGAVSTSMPYSSRFDTISRLAAVGSDVRWLMSSGFVVFGVAVAAASVAIRRDVASWAWVAALTTAVATLAVAAAPLDASPIVDALHLGAAGLGYVSLAAVPVLAHRPLRDTGRVALARFGVIISCVCAGALVVSLVVEQAGLFQRIGLTAGDVFVVVFSVSILSRPETAPPATTASTR